MNYFDRVSDISIDALPQAPVQEFGAVNDEFSTQQDFAPDTQDLSQTMVTLKREIESVQRNIDQWRESKRDDIVKKLTAKELAPRLYRLQQIQEITNGT